MVAAMAGAAPLVLEAIGIRFGMLCGIRLQRLAQRRAGDGMGGETTEILLGLPQRVDAPQVLVGHHMQPKLPNRLRPMAGQQTTEPTAHHHRLRPRIVWPQLIEEVGSVGCL